MSVETTHHSIIVNISDVYCSNNSRGNFKVGMMATLNIK